MVAAVGGFTHFRRDGGGHRSHRICQHGRDAIVVTGRQEDGMVSPTARPHAQHTGGQQAVARSREEDAADGFPGICAEGQGRFAK